jgi:hypothetical protein
MKRSPIHREKLLKAMTASAMAGIALGNFPLTKSAIFKPARRGSGIV